ncbi:MAG: hypothetical protein ACLQVD_05140 [Capsulimonadaceae bacterium]
MNGESTGPNMTESEWSGLISAVTSSRDILDDGAYVEATAGEFVFYASALNMPPAWHYSFPESISGVTRPVASIGRVRHDTASGFVRLEVSLLAAALALKADFEGGTGDFDDVAFEQAVEAAVTGTPADLEWLSREFDRLRRIVTH